MPRVPRPPDVGDAVPHGAHPAHRKSASTAIAGGAQSHGDVGKPPTSPPILARLHGVTDAVISVAVWTLRLAFVGGVLYALDRIGDPAVQARWRAGSRRWLAHPIRRLLEPLKSRWDTVAREAATRRLTHANRNLPRAIFDDSAINERFIAAAVLAWCRAAPVMLLTNLCYLALLMTALVNVGFIARQISAFIHATWRLITGQHKPAYASSKSDEIKTLDPLGYLADKAQSFGHWVWDRWGPITKIVNDPQHPAIEGVLSLGVMLVIGWLLLTAFRVVWAHMRSLRSGPPNPRDTRTRPGKPDRNLSSAPSILGMSKQHQPVLILLQCVERVGEAHKRWGSGHLLDAPRVAFPDAERAIWNAWKTRHDSVRRPVRRKQKEHAAEVIGALRAAEERQHSEDDTGRVLEETAILLLTIASRYAEGRTGELLDRSQLDGITPATNFTWLRMLLFGGVTTAAGVGCTVLGLPAEAAAPAMGLVLFIGSRAILGFRLGAAETLELFRSGK